MAIKIYLKIEHLFTILQRSKETVPSPWTEKTVYLPKIESNTIEDNIIKEMM